VLPEDSSLAVGCKASRCGAKVPMGARRHSFSSPTQAGLLPGFAGACAACGAMDLVDWERCHVHDPGDTDSLIKSLRLELIRDTYWTELLPEHVLRKAGKRTEEQLSASIGISLRSGLQLNHPREGRQTPWATSPKATIIDCARHATATCCRRCLEKWHGYSITHDLSGGDLQYLSGLAWTYAERRLDEPAVSGGFP
jgi:hypothetical protein